jgi:hypothetical protein
LIAEPGVTDIQVTAQDEEQMDRAVSASEALTEELEGQLKSDDPEQRQLAQLQLAAGAAVDAGIAADLARREDLPRDDQLAFPADETIESLSPIIGEATVVLQANSLSDLPAAGPSGGVPGGPNAESLDKAIDEAMAAITKDSSELAELAVGGMVKIAGSFAGSLIDVLENIFGDVVDQAGVFLKRGVRLLISSVKKLLAPLGSALSGELFDKATDWLEGLKKADFLGKALDAIWESENRATDAKGEIAEKGANLTDQRTKAGVDNLKALSKRYDHQSGLVRKVLKVAKFLTPVIAGMTPGGPIVLGVGFTSALVFVVFSGGDYVDWTRFGDENFLDQVKGVRHLAAAV